MFHAIPRDAAGHIVLPGRQRVFDVDFAQVAALPSWLTATAETGGSYAITGGELVLTAPATGNCYVQGPSVSTGAVESIAITAYDQHRTGLAAGSTYLALSTVPSIMSNGALGAQIHQPGGSSTYLRGTIGDWPVTPSLLVDVEPRPEARLTRTLVYLPRTGMVYAIEDETEVMHARDLSATLVAGTVAPLFMSRGSAILHCSRLKIAIGYA